MNRKDESEELSEVASVEIAEAPEGEGETLIELLLGEQMARAPEERAAGASAPDPEPSPAEERPAAPARIDGVVVGEIVAFDSPGAPRVAYPGGPAEGIGARALAGIGPEDVGAAVALLFEGGDPQRPLVMGRMHAAALPRGVEVKADGDRLELTAEKEIVLRCGNSSITLTRAGKILIRGAYVLSRSSGVNRIQGGSVEIN